MNITQDMQSEEFLTEKFKTLENVIKSGKGFKVNKKEDNTLEILKDNELVELKEDDVKAIEFFLNSLNVFKDE